MNKFLKIFFALILGLFFASCFDNPSDSPIGNQPPDTGLFLYPDSTISQQPSRLKVSWWGDDPDGVVIGYYFSWDGTNWSFTSRNDSLFSLQIGASDTTYMFMVAAVDDGGNGKYDNVVIRNNINFGPEPFVDANGNGVFDAGEAFFDIGLVDPTPAAQNFPIKNSAPEIEWNTFSTLPDTSFPVMSFGWEASDIDGDASIQSIQIALNDTSNFIALDGSVRRITVRPLNSNPNSDQLQVLIDGSQTNIADNLLSGIILNGNNRIYIQAVDISGASSGWIALPDTGKTWYVKKPVGELLILDDYSSFDDDPGFYFQMMDSLGLSNKYSYYNIHASILPFINITFFETIKLFKYLIWYSDNNPSLDLANATSQKFIDGGGKILYSLQFPQNIDLTFIQGFLPMISADSSDYRPSIPGGSHIISDTTSSEYPNLITTGGSLFRIRSFYLPSGLTAQPIYYLPNNNRNSFIGFASNEKNLFFIGLPLHKLNGSGTVKQLLEKVLFEDFNLTP